MEHSFACPHCGEEISMVLDLSVHKQTYVEDCEVCCNPIEVSYTVSDEELVEFSAGLWDDRRLKCQRILQRNPIIRPAVGHTIMWKVRACIHVRMESGWSIGRHVDN